MRPDLFDHFPLRTARVHEVCGAGAVSFAAAAAAQAERVLWVREAWRTEVMNPVGLSAFFDPSHMLMAKTGNQIETLAVAEETLKDGAIPFVVIEITRPLDLREGRRLQLAAKSGGTTGLCLIPEGMGSNAAETRWHCEPVFDPTGEDSTLMRWSLKKNKSGTLCDWYVRWTPFKTHPADRLAVVSPPAQ
jgi:protein ImuA